MIVVDGKTFCDGLDPLAHGNEAAREPASPSPSAFGPDELKNVLTPIWKENRRSYWFELPDTEGFKRTDYGSKTQCEPHDCGGGVLAKELHQIRTAHSWTQNSE